MALAGLSDSKDIFHLVRSYTWKAPIFPNDDQNSEPTTVVSLCQIPLLLGLAITIHKAQGATLQQATMTLDRDVFSPGQGYVWFSGMFDNDLAIPKFVGKFNAAGEDLNAVVKWLKIESQNLKFDNLAQYRFNCDILYSSTTTAINNLYLNLN